ncbi:MAG: sulfite exporter TauE/SafE family protein [Planctomycetota bacterium]
MMFLWFFLIGCLMGFLSSLLGIGGGIVVVPALTLLLGWPIKKAIVTSLAIIVPVAVMGVGSHWRDGNLPDLKAALLIAVGGIISAVLGTWVCGNLSNLVVRKIFAICTILVGVQMFFTKSRAADKSAPEATVAAPGSVRVVDELP